MSAETPSPKEANLADQATRPGRLRRWGSRLVGMALRLGAAIILVVVIAVLLAMYGGERVRVPGLPLTVRLANLDQRIEPHRSEDGAAGIATLTFAGRRTLSVGPGMILRSVPVPEGTSPGDWERLPDKTVVEEMPTEFSPPLGSSPPTHEVTIRRYRKVFRPDLAIEVQDKGILFGDTIRESIQLAPEP